MESGVDVFNDNLPKYKPSFANRNDSFLEILVSKPILSIPYDLTPLFSRPLKSTHLRDIARKQCPADFFNK